MSAPAIILVRPQMGENIGAAARAMANFGLKDLRIVAARDGWPNPAAEAMAAGALDLLGNARLFDTTEEAVADLQQVWATTARSRDVLKPVATAARAAEDMTAADPDLALGVLFGPERSGLDNHDVALADVILQVPTSPENPSINLAQGVLLIAYEWFQRQQTTPELMIPEGKSAQATKEEFDGFFEHLIGELDACGFLRNREQRPIMVRNLRAMFTRAGLYEQEVRTLRGVVKCLIQGRKPLPPKAGDET
ncbi:MAG: rRNA methyltransferase [Rhodospirillaceae bacterium]|nr:rRNA methyltransferase [Rhodospirillaceae bacterium]|tara:strand:+ start:3630 stop:4382 length:753 start_codon:yes stop_codon:yes gene_type:complete